MKRLLLALSATLALTIPAQAHKMNEKGESIALGGRVEDPAFMAQDELVQSLRHLPISNEERQSFSVILRPSSGKNWAVGHNISACYFSETSDDSFRRDRSGMV